MEACACDTPTAKNRQASAQTKSWRYLMHDFLASLDGIKSQFNLEEGLALCGTASRAESGGRAAVQVEVEQVPVLQQLLEILAEAMRYIFQRRGSMLTEMPFPTHQHKTGATPSFAAWSQGVAFV
jgi:hypothetical protein